MVDDTGSSAAPDRPVSAALAEPLWGAAEARLPARPMLCFLILMFVALYLPGLGLQELRPREALAATIAREAGPGGGPFMTLVHGHHVQAFPVYPMLARWASLWTAPTPWRMRLPSALAVLGLAALAGLAARHLRNSLAGLVAFAMVVCTPITLRTGTQAIHDAVLALFLGLGWLAWYRLGRELRQWPWAWFVAMLCVLAATLTAGATALVYFYLPLLFLRRPLRGRRRLLFPSSLACFGILGVIIGLWLSAVPGQPFMPWSTLTIVTRVDRAYITQFLAFPFAVAGSLMPWTFAAWPAFCAAFRPVEQNRVAMHFMRTIVTTLFIMLWVLPDTTTKALTPMVLPLAVMAGIHYEILLRRHGRLLRRLQWLLAWVGLVVSAAALLVPVLHCLGLVVFAGIPAGSAIKLAVAGAGGILASQWLRTVGRRRAFLIQFTVGIAVIRLVLATGYLEFERWRHDERREAGRLLATAVPVLMLEPDPVPPPWSRGALGDAALPFELFHGGADVVVHRVTGPDLVTECYYLGRPVVEVADPVSELAGSAHTIYALSDDKPPIQPARVWRPCGPLVDVRNRRSMHVAWFPDEGGVLRVSRVDSVDAPGHVPAPVRMYAGTRR